MGVTFWDKYIDDIEKEAKEIVRKTSHKVDLADIKTALRIAYATKSPPILEDLLENIKLKGNLGAYDAVYSGDLISDLNFMLSTINMGEESLQLLKDYNFIDSEYVAYFLMFDEYDVLNNMDMFNRYVKVFKDDIITIAPSMIDAMLTELCINLEQDPDLTYITRKILYLAVETFNIPEDNNELIQLKGVIEECERKCY